MKKLLTLLASLIVVPAWATIALDDTTLLGMTTSNSVTHDGNTTAVSGVVVCIVEENDNEEITAVSYGALSLTENNHLVKTTTTTQFVTYIFTSLPGDTIPTGSQTVSVTSTGTQDKGVFIYSFTGTDDMGIVDTDELSTSTPGTTPGGTLSLGGVTSFALLCVGSGHNTNPDVQATTGWTKWAANDHGNQGSHAIYYDTIASSDISWSYDQTASGEDETNTVAVAVADGFTAGGGGNVNLFSGKFGPKTKGKMQ